MQGLSNLKNFGKKSRFHIVGIGGIGMSGIAEILHNFGYYIQGSDMANNINTERLEKLGVKIFIGHNAENITSSDYVVISTSILENNIEYIAAKQKKIPIIRRSEMLAEIMKMKSSISITGSHGKTSTTSMIASLFESAGLDPTVINGGIINSKSTNAYVGNGDFMIVEADESDGTFIKVPSSIGVITNIDPEHLDYYKTFDNLYNSFKQFIHNLPFYGFAVICADHKTARKLSGEIIDRKVITYGIESTDVNIRAFNIRPEGVGSRFDVRVSLPLSHVEYTIEEIYLAIPGKHNVLNSLAAVAIGAELDFGIKSIKEGLLNFKGVKRRFTKTGEINGVVFIDDYAHHPEEVKATLATAKEIARDNNKIIAIFQPHRYSRFSSLFNEFVESMKDANEIYISPVYAAGENPIEGYDNNKLASALMAKFPEKKISAISGFQDLPNIYNTRANKGDIILFMGAGNITSWAYELPLLIQEQENE